MTELEIQNQFKIVCNSKGVKDRADVIAMWTVLKVQLTNQEIFDSLKHVIKKRVYRLDPADFIEAARGSQNNKIQNAVTRVQECLRKHGHTHPKKAKEFLGAPLWAAIGYSGGYQEVCEKYDGTGGFFHRNLVMKIEAGLESNENNYQLEIESSEVNEVLNATLKTLEVKK